MSKGACRRRVDSVTLCRTGVVEF